MEKITFEKSASEFVLDAFGKKIDPDGYIVERQEPKQFVLTPDAEKIKLEEFGGIRRGSEIFIKNDLMSLIDALRALK